MHRRLRAATLMVWRMRLLEHRYDVVQVQWVVHTALHVVSPPLRGNILRSNKSCTAVWFG